ncbi:hypothetical protein [Thalassotalea sp. PS06]|uniref:hypothetical protein n=1 Tax=Thalassotalea sp. PS06 TaxID=2594005 RepID=UPI0011642170|nr:hypothetical protein [Thalassotalea sp. PS06]QDP02300.1 hypothetical protein FNC98_13680 [Thalassotalea sp. PS06]
MRVSVLISVVILMFSPLSMAGEGEAVDKEKLKHIVDGWTTGTWEPLVIRVRGEGGWNISDDEEKPAVAKKNDDYSLTFYEAGGEPMWVLDFSSGYYDVKSYDKEKKKFGETYRASFVSYELNGPDDFSFLIMWDEPAKDGSKRYSEGTSLGAYKSWSGFKLDSKGGRNYNFSNIFTIKATSATP